MNSNYFISLLIDRIDNTYYDNFGVFYNNTLSYLYTNPEKDVVKHNIDNPLDVPRHLPDTRIPNHHAGSIITGIHVGHYFWIFKGYAEFHSMNHYDSHKLEIKSSLWSLKKDTWINGPEIPEGLIRESPCATAINDTFAIIININLYTDSIPALAYDFSKGLWHPMSKPPTSQFSEGLNTCACSCVAMYEKTYRQ